MALSYLCFSPRRTGRLMGVTLRNYLHPVNSVFVILDKIGANIKKAAQCATSLTGRTSPQPF